MWTVRLARAGDGPQLQALRMRALRESGSAFLETVEEAQGLSPAAWEARIARYTRRGRQVLVVAEDRDQAWVGMAGAFRDIERDSEEFDLPNPPVAPGDRWAMVWGTYVDVIHRRRGLADALCGELYRWAAEEACVDWLGLHVRDSNVRAIDLYSRQGYRVVARHTHLAIGVTSLVMVQRIT